jgi:protein TonB
MGVDKMSTDESHKHRAEMHDEEYESTVLDFLDKEIAAAQPLQDQKSQSDDLDALVSDLMKQVITESNQLEGPAGGPDQITSEPPPEQSKAAPVAAAEHSVGPKESEPARPAENVSEVPAGVLFKARPKPRRVVPLIAFASLCLLASIGVVIHYSGSRGRAPVPQAAPTSPAASMPAAVVPHTAPQRVASTVPAQPKPAPVPNEPVPAVPPPKPLQAETKPMPVQQPAAAAKTPEVSAPIPNRSAESKPVQNEKPRQENPPIAAAVTANVAPAAPATPAPSPAPAVVERAPVSLPAIPETASLAGANTDRIPEKPLAPISSKIESFVSPVTPAGSNAREMIPSKPISQASPSYPDLAMRTRASGSVVLDLDIDAEGRVVKATPVSGPAMFYSAAVSAALKWRYRPASIGGKNVPSQSRVTMVFNLKK